MKQTIIFNPSDLNKLELQLQALGYISYNTAYDPFEQVTVYLMTNTRKGNIYEGSAVDIREDGKATFYAMHGCAGVSHPIAAVKTHLS